MKKVKSFSPGKVIISGEHSVVYGQPALLASINLGTTVTLSSGAKEPGNLLGKVRDLDLYTNHICQVVERQLNIKLPGDWYFKVKSNLPVKAGLGSSAAYAHAVIQAVSQMLEADLSPNELFELVWSAEDFVHGRSSGADPAAVVYGGLISFQVIDGQPRTAPVKTAGQVFQLVLIDSGSAVESTKQMVKIVAKQNKPEIIKELGKITQQLIDELSFGQLNPKLINQSQQLLVKLGVVGYRAQSIINQVKKAGGKAKITGAGGAQAGSGWLLCWHPNPALLEELAAQNQTQSLLITIPEESQNES